METVALIAPYVSIASTAVSAVGSLMQSSYKQTEYNDSFAYTSFTCSPTPENKISFLIANTNDNMCFNTEIKYIQHIVFFFGTWPWKIWCRGVRGGRWPRGRRRRWRWPSPAK